MEYSGEQGDDIVKHQYEISTDDRHMNTRIWAVLFRTSSCFCSTPNSLSVKHVRDIDSQCRDPGCRLLLRTMGRNH